MARQGMLMNEELKLYWQRTFDGKARCRGARSGLVRQEFVPTGYGFGYRHVPTTSKGLANHV